MYKARGARTSSTDGEEDDGGSREEADDACNDLGSRARGVNRCTGTMRAKGDVVCWRDRRQQKGLMGVDDRDTGRGHARRRNVPAFFSSTESVFQSFFWISSSCWWMTSCSSAERRSHIASTFESGMTGDADDAAGAAVCAELAAAANARVAGRRGRRGRARRRACMGTTAGTRRKSEEGRREDGNAWTEGQETRRPSRRHEKATLYWPALSGTASPVAERGQSDLEGRTQRQRGARPVSPPRSPSFVINETQKHTRFCANHCTMCTHDKRQDMLYLGA